MAGGGLMQLVAYGAQDTYLTGNPGITFFNVTYKRQTNFKAESIEKPIDTPDYGRGRERGKEYGELESDKPRIKELRFKTNNEFGIIIDNNDDVRVRIIDKHDGECCICLEHYKDGTGVGLLDCGHHMHNDCITDWLDHNDSCPLCRSVVFGVEI